jgi:putative DNA primase/helicase
MAGDGTTGADRAAALTQVFPERSSPRAHLLNASTQHAPLNEHHIRAHVQGADRYGIIPFIDDEQVVWACIDLDAKCWKLDEEGKLRSLTQAEKDDHVDGLGYDCPEVVRVRDALLLELASRGFVVLLECSRGGGWHIWIVFAEPVLARVVRHILRPIVLGVGIPDATDLICPRSDSAPGTGNGVYLPWSGQSTGPHTQLFEIDPISGEWVQAPEQIAALLNWAKHPTPVSVLSDASEIESSSGTDDNGKLKTCPENWDRPEMQRVLAELQERGLLRGARTDRGQTACCPAHADQRPSLSVAPGTKGVLFHCFAGCKHAAIVAALSLEPEEVFFFLDSFADHQTDLGNAELFRDQFRGQIVFCTDENRWRWWDGKRWAPDDGDHASQLGHELIYQLHRQGDRKRAKKLQSRARFRAMLDMAMHLEGIAVRVEEFDTSDHLLNVENGTLNLDTFELHPHDPNDRITKLAPVLYNPSARSDLWERVLRDVLPDGDTSLFLQRFYGYALHGCKDLDTLLLMHGPTRCGKGTIQGAVSAALGNDYVRTVSSRAFAERKFVEMNAPEVAALRGARLANIYESGTEIQLDATLIKTITGHDPITAAEKYKNPVTFTPQFALVIATNTRPGLPADDDAVWERLIELPFNGTIPEEKRDPKVREALRDDPENRSAVLTWAVEGFRMLREEGLKPPTRVRQASSDYRSEMNHFNAFIDSECVLGSDLKMPVKVLNSAYSDWCKEAGLKPLNYREFPKRLEALGCRRDRTGRGRFWSGIGLQQERGGFDQEQDGVADEEASRVN